MQNKFFTIYSFIPPVQIRYQPKISFSLAEIDIIDLQLKKLQSQGVMIQATDCVKGD